MALAAPIELALQHMVAGCISLERHSQKCFYEHFYGYAFSVCHRYVSHEEETIEVINDAFLKIFREIGRFQSRQDSLENSLKAWIRRISINTAIDHLRKQRINTIELDDNSDTTENLSRPPVAMERLSHKELLALISRLSPGYRMVFNLYVIDGYTHEEIAGILDISTGTSKSNLAKARLNLQKMIIKEQQQVAAYGRRAI
ncbi:RNA polymerase sigma factor [Flavihumibacter stibioxidans]|uniref:RNA polymerase sigma-70 factor (ECF subfamily) n=1 Tax=Flavihumibacter stibioxidans TaxID=1834163 RepID=A0ABR7M8W4_9BACT|nr:RNA polymerase sigma factor [Flavihumibacter stibioxidans]MBC6490974.1 hypothetical protein [Flavihumibacter stibioxidans]